MSTSKPTTLPSTESRNPYRNGQEPGALHGADPTTGQPYLPDARTSPAAQRRGIPTYQVRGVLCDWLLFTHLQARSAAAATPAQPNADLNTALRLVSGRPFSRTRTNGWSWIFEGNRIDLQATNAVVTIANTLAEHHRADGNHPAHEQALAVAAAAETD